MIHATVDEVLEHLWYAAEENRVIASVADLHADVDDLAFRDAMNTLVAEGAVLNGDGCRLSDSGERRARAIVRRHRLAEVLFVETFGTSLQEAETSACEMEHMLSEPVVERVCAFLGHPPVCPHGKPVPRGECCLVFTKRIEPLMMRVTDLGIGERATIAFVAPTRSGRIERLAAFGVVRGSEIRLVARNPSCVISCGSSSIALDDDIGHELYVRRA